MELHYENRLCHLLRQLLNDTAKILPKFFVIAMRIQRIKIRNAPRSNWFLNNTFFFESLVLGAIERKARIWTVKKSTGEFKSEDVLKQI